jgi:hypothetical protein
MKKEFTKLDMKQFVSLAQGILEDEKKLISFCSELTQRRNQWS